jgi:nucleoside-diphosphate-sugar epimerase/glyoxylase-like metal-dependent hydrolase (beta-lactamase superfamily II)
MVDTRVVNSVKELFGNRVLRILVTGGTGFVGSTVAKLLAEAGQKVTVTGRNRYKTSRLWHPKINFVVSDICDASSVNSICLGQDVVIHAAAFAATWGDAAKFYAVNVQGTQNIVNACRDRPDVRVVYVSSTAIHFEFCDKQGVQEDSVLPKQFACEYAKSKAEAECVIRKGVENGLNAITVRARAVFGPGDNSLLPRLVVAASDGRLPQIGDGDNIVDLTYVDNLAYALCLAIMRGKPGSVCTITNEEPVSLWPTLNQIFENLGLPTTRRRVTYTTAMFAAKAASISHRLLRRRGEPKLTTYSVGLLAKSQTFSPEAAHKLLGYRPIVSMEEGTEQTLQSLRANDDGHASCSVELTLFTTGYTPQPYFLAERGRGRSKEPFHATCALIKHPRYGLFLFDTGYSPAFYGASHRFPYSVYGFLSPLVHSTSLTIRAQLKERGIEPDEIRGIIVSHFHADHVAGLRDFDKSEFIASQTAWDDVADRRGFSALKRGFLPDLLPNDFSDRIRPVEHFHDPGIGPFKHAHDLFGDGSVRLIPIPGHARGQIGAFVQSGPNQRTFLAADATWTLASLRANRLPHWLTYSFIDSVTDLKSTLSKLHTFSKQYPTIDIVPTHCPEIAMRSGFDAVVRERLERISP